MRPNPWTIGLAAVGAASFASVVQADEAPGHSPVQTALSSTTISGYVDTSAQWNLGTGNANNPGYSYNAPTKADGFNLNVVKLTIAKDPDASAAWGAGYKVDLLFGPDADLVETQSSSATAASDFGIEQAYVDLKAPVGNGLDFKIGVWSTIIGYEVFESVNNPNFTRSYGWTIEPTVHTGVQSSYQVNGMVSVTAGIVDSFGPSINARSFPAKAESFKTYMASVSFTAPTNWGWASGSTLSGCVINGFNSASPANQGNGATQTSLYAGGTLNTPLKGLKFGVAYDYVTTENQTVFNGTTFIPVKSGYANAVGLYTTYQATEKLSLNGRAEYFSHSGGPFAVAVPGGGFVSLPAKAFEVTLTAQYDLWKNVLSRVEFRWDHAADGTKDFGGTTPPAAPGAPPPGNRFNAYELIGNVAYKF